MTSMSQLAETSTANGREPTEEEIRQVVQRVVFQGMGIGMDMSESALRSAAAQGQGGSTRTFSTIQEGVEEDEAKRPKRSTE